MTIGKRIKAGRNMAGLSQRALAKRVGLSAMAISKYENGVITPGSQMLLKFCKAMGVPLAYFFPRQPVILSDPLYRRRANLGVTAERAILARVQEWLERYLDTEDLLGVSHHFEWPAGLDRHVTCMEDTERVACELRRLWNLGLAPIESLIEILEERGIKVELFEGPKAFDALTVKANDEVPVIVVKDGLPGDRQRFNLAHELGHLVMTVMTSNVDEDKAAYRFAGAFLVPEEVARMELGDHRHSLTDYELHMLKHKYGLSMQGWIHRAQDLQIINDAAATALYRRFSKAGWRVKEPGDQLEQETPRRLERLITRALAEEVISKSRAAELLGRPVEAFREEVAKQHGGLLVWST